MSTTRNTTNNILKLMIIYIFISTISTQDIIQNELQNNSQKDLNETHRCLKYYKYDNKTKSCEHTNLFPLDFYKLFEIFIISGISMIATASGIGGGGIYSTTFIFIENFASNQAFPITSFLMFWCALSTYYLGIQNKIKYPSQKFVDYDFACLVFPGLLFGNKLGTILNKIAPNILINFIFLALQIFVTINLYKRYEYYLIK